eukprot:scaffold73_cov252-Pinguiococcus_pyrenoidosus.AAC.26
MSIQEGLTQADKTWTWIQLQNAVRGRVPRVLKVTSRRKDRVPDRHRVGLQLSPPALCWRVEQEGAEPAAVHAVVKQEDKKPVVELEADGVPLDQMRDALQELPKDGAPLLGGAEPDVESGAIVELVAELEPVLLDEAAEAGDGSIVRIQDELGQGGHLACAVPAVAAVQQDVRATARHRVDGVAHCGEHAQDVVLPGALLDEARPGQRATVGWHDISANASQGPQRAKRQVDFRGRSWQVAQCHLARNRVVQGVGTPPHDVDVGNPQEVQAAVHVAPHVLEAFACRLVDGRVQPRAHVEDHELGFLVQPRPDLVQERLVVDVPSPSHSNFRLAAAEDGSAAPLVHVRDHRDPLPTPKGGAELDVRVLDGRRRAEQLRVGLAQREVLVDGRHAKAASLRVDADAGVLAREVEKRPAVLEEPCRFHPVALLFDLRAVFLGEVFVAVVVLLGALDVVRSF